MSNVTKEKTADEKATEEKVIKGTTTKEKMADRKTTKDKAGEEKVAGKNVDKTRVRVEKDRTQKVKREAATAMEIIAARNKMQDLLEQMRQKGVKLFVDGEAALPGEIAAKAVCEGSAYMADYVLGENGAIEQVRFDKVTRK